MGSLLFATSLSLFILMDPFGNIPIYLSVLRKIDPSRRMWIVFREKLIALLLVFLFALCGHEFVKILNLSYESIDFAGAVVLFLMSLKMIFPEKGSLSDAFVTESAEPLIFPLATPLVAGPTVLAAVIIYSVKIQPIFVLYLSIFIAWVISMLILLVATYLSKWLGDKGLSAIERLMGLILLMMAINMFLEGVELFDQNRAKKITRLEFVIADENPLC